MKNRLLRVEMEADICIWKVTVKIETEYKNIPIRAVPEMSV